MAGPGTEPPDGGTGGGGEINNQPPNPRVSYSDRLKTNINFNQRLKRNILEITLERTNKDAEMKIDQEEISRVFKTLGIDIVSQVEGYQVHYKGRNSVISVWMPPGVNVEKFCKDVNITVNSNVVTGLIRPAGKTDVTVSIVGLNFNTPDTFVFEYLGKFGTLKNKSVIYSKYDEGPFKGKFNGERKYQVDFTGGGRQMGTYHLIDNCKVRVFFRGNQKTCGRCHRSARDCVGGGLARNCEAGGGERVLLSDHMRKLWQEIGFAPTSFALEDVIDENNENPVNDAPVLTENRFPASVVRKELSDEEIQKCDGITVKNIPATVEEKEIWTFLMNYGLPLNHGIENVKVDKRERNTWVVIHGLKPEEVKVIHTSLHFPITNQRFFDAQIYCKPLRNMTPVKSQESSLGSTTE